MYLEYAINREFSLSVSIKNFNIQKVVPIEYIIKKLITMVYIYIVRIVNYK